jgi:hypothetical protein
MSSILMTPPLAAAVQDVSSGATAIARQVIDGLFGLAEEPERLCAAAALVADQLPWCAPMWHVLHAARVERPLPALRALRDRLDFDVDRSVATATKLLTERGHPVRIIPGSDLVAAVLRGLPRPAGAGVVGLVGADAIGPTEMLNTVGTGALAGTAPTVVVTTSVKLVPEEAFQRLGAPGFERVPLHRFDLVVIDGEVLTPAEAGQRAAALAAGHTIV